MGIDDRQNSTNQIVKIIQNNKNFTISFSCYDSKELAIQADNLGANFISFGAFFPTKTKISPGKPDLEIIDWAKKNLKAKYFADVLNDEINYKKNKLIKYSKTSDQVVITPHIGGMTVEGQNIAYNHALNLLIKYNKNINS